MDVLDNNKSQKCRLLKWQRCVTCWRRKTEIDVDLMDFIYLFIYLFIYYGNRTVYILLAEFKFLAPFDHWIKMIMPNISDNDVNA